MFDVFDINIFLPLYDTSPRRTFIGSVNLLWNISAAIRHSSPVFCHWGAKGGSLPLASDLWGVVFVFTMMYFSQPWTSKYCDFPSLFNGFMMHYCAKPLEQAWKVTSFTRSWMWIEYRLLNRLVLLLCHGKSNLKQLGWGANVKRGCKGGLSTRLLPEYGRPPSRSWCYILDHLLKM